MNLTQLNIILADQQQKQSLVELVNRKIEIDQSIASYSDDLDDIKKNAEKLGLKVTEFNKIVKCMLNSEATLNEMAALELINDHLMDNAVL